MRHVVACHEPTRYGLAVWILQSIFRSWQIFSFLVNFVYAATAIISTHPHTRSVTGVRYISALRRQRTAWQIIQQIVRAKDKHTMSGGISWNAEKQALIFLIGPNGMLESIVYGSFERHEGAHCLLTSLFTFHFFHFLANNFHIAQGWARKLSCWYKYSINDIFLGEKCKWWALNVVMVPSYYMRLHLRRREYSKFIA